MKILLFGLGYVGTTVSACLATQGHSVYAIDPNVQKVEGICDGISPISEPGVENLLNEARALGNLYVSTTLERSLDEFDLVFVCVGTPSLLDGKPDMSQVEAVTKELGFALKNRTNSNQVLLVYRSTMLPNSIENTILPLLLKYSGLEPGDTYEVAYNPEFLRESTSVKDYMFPPKIVIGERSPGLASKLVEAYNDIDAPLFCVPLQIAEFTKYVDNNFHAMKVAFANEVGRVAKSAGIDIKVLIDIFLSDTKLNISPYYLVPGGAFGGSCLPKDSRALVSYGAGLGLDLPLFKSILDSNSQHKKFIANMVSENLLLGARILLLGLSFKNSTDDLRESPLVDLAENILGKGFELEILDPDLDPSTLIGQNLRYVDTHLPHLSRILISEVCDWTIYDRVVIGKPLPEIESCIPSSVTVININRL